MKIPNTSEWTAIGLHAYNIHHDQYRSGHDIMIYMSSKMRTGEYYHVYYNSDHNDGYRIVHYNSSKPICLVYMPDFNSCANYILEHINENT